MFKSIEHILEYFPMFLDKTDDSNLHKLATVLGIEYKEIRNTLESVRDGYYYMGGGEVNNLNLESTPARIHEKNNALLETPDNTNGIVNFTSTNEGHLGDVDLTNYDNLELETPSLMKDKNNNIIYSTSTLKDDSLIEFQSKLTGYIGCT